MDIGLKIAKYNREAGKARQILSERFNEEITSINLQLALADVLGYDDHDSNEILGHDL